MISFNWISSASSIMNRQPYIRGTVLILFSTIIFGCNKQPSTPVDHVPTLRQGHEMNNDHAHGTGHNVAEDHVRGAGHHAGHAATRRKLEVQPDTVRAGVETKIQMSIPAEDAQLVKDFKESHDAKLHLIIVREGLDRFAHLHPDVNAESGELTVQHTFEVGGTYFFFADFREADGTAGIATGKLAVAGDAPAPSRLIPDVPGIITTDALKAQITVAGIKAGEEGTIDFDLSTPDGKPVSDLEPYMGALGHLNAVSADATQFVHAHPSDSPGQKSRVTFSAHFEKPGIYKGWGQFKRGGQVQIVPFVVEVE